MKDFVEYVCSFLVKDHESLSINRVDLEERIVLELNVKESDLGRVIGKEGRVAKAMRTLLSIGNKENQKPYYLEIIE